MVQSIDQQLNTLIKSLRDIRYNQVPIAHSSAINKSVSRIRARTVRGVSRETKVPAKYIRRRFVVSKSKPRSIRSKVTIWQQGVSVADFARSPKKGKAVRFGGRKISNSFYNDVASGKTIAFQREGSSRYPVKIIKVDIKGPIDRIFPKVSARVMSKEFPVLLNKELIFRISKYAKL